MGGCTPGVPPPRSANDLEPQPHVAEEELHIFVCSGVGSVATRTLE